MRERAGGQKKEEKKKEKEIESTLGFSYQELSDPKTEKVVRIR